MKQTANNSSEVIEVGRDLPARITTLIDQSDAIGRIASSLGERAHTGQLATFRTFTDVESVERIAGQMTEINRAVSCFGRKNSQTTNKLMTLMMLQDSSPYRVLRQCLSEIQNRRGAIREAYYDLKRKKVEIEVEISRIDQMRDGPERDIAAINLESLIAETVETVLYFEGALKDIASFQSAYYQICENKNIPPDWDERDFEAAEIRSHVRYAFLLAYRNMLSHGTLDAGTLEYLHQFGIHAQRAFDEVVAYIEGDTGGTDDYEGLEQWLDSMADKYGNEYKKAMARIGLTSLIDEWAQYHEHDPEQTASEMFSD